MPNIYTPRFDQDRHAPAGFRAQRALLGRQAGAEQLGLSLWELPPGEAAYPYHLHLCDEELIIVLDGTPSLRTPSGWRALERGEVVSFRSGERGAHQLVNWAEETARFLSFSPAARPDATIYPDSRKVGIAERRRDGLAMRIAYDRADVDYWAGETAPTRSSAPASPDTSRPIE